jgi:(p)ppGpp synthase/HD superfamily hydrolase
MKIMERPQVAQAIEFAQRVHEGQFRPGGESQLDHLMRVLKVASAFVHSMSEEDAIAVLVASVLHDTLEDTDTTDHELADMFGERVARIVRAVSHEEEEEPDEGYLRRVATGGRLAVIVKRADRLDNLNSLRQASSEFRGRKLSEIRAALPIWYEIDPDGASTIEELLKEVEYESATS